MLSADLRKEVRTAVPLQQWSKNVSNSSPQLASPPEAEAPLLSASSAWLTLRHRTGIPVSRATFYRWLSNGKIYSTRLGLKLYVPLSTIEELVRKSGSEEPLAGGGRSSD
ncbi:MAG TPA: helix-turn-helix domain-containing protein [Terriglobia bacterium]|nr:helix-turn-helix domain-containing protein [Terriglobia bacterium]